MGVQLPNDGSRSSTTAELSIFGDNRISRVHARCCSIWPRVCTARLQDTALVASRKRRVGRHLVGSTHMKLSRQTLFVVLVILGLYGCTTGSSRKWSDYKTPAEFISARIVYTKIARLAGYSTAEGALCLDGRSGVTINTLDSEIGEICKGAGDDWSSGKFCTRRGDPDDLRFYYIRSPAPVKVHGQCYSGQYNVFVVQQNSAATDPAVLRLAKLVGFQTTAEQRQEATRKKAEEENIAGERLRMAQARADARLAESARARLFQKSLTTGSKTNCGPIIEIRGDLGKVYKPVEGYGTEHWLELDKLYPPTYACSFYNGRYIDPMM